MHSAAQRFPDKVEKDYDASYALNVTASKNLAALAGKFAVHEHAPVVK